MNCSVCGKPDDLECPACDKAFCVSCFVDHGKACCHSQKKTEQGGQKKCSACGRYASHSSVVHCSDCQQEFCRSCLWVHKKTHEEEKAKANWRYCVNCGDRLKEKYSLCGTCNGSVCSDCEESHQRLHKNYCAQCSKLHYNDILHECGVCHKLICVSCGPEHNEDHRRKSRYRCSGCGNPTTIECDECHKPYCFPCFAKHRAVHEHQAQTWHWCAGCNRAKQQDANKSGSPYWQCPTCHEYYCEACTMRHTHVYARANFAGRFNVDDFTIHGVDFKIDPDFIKESLKTAERIRQEQEAKQKKQEEEARRRKEEEFQREKARLNEEFFRRFFGGSYASFSSSSTELEMAFSVLQLSTRATVQEVTRAFRRKAKQGEYKHPDVGGSEEAFKKLNNAYELALAHAKRNER